MGLTRPYMRKEISKRKELDTKTPNIFSSRTTQLVVEIAEGRSNKRKPVAKAAKRQTVSRTQPNDLEHRAGNKASNKSFQNVFVLRMTSGLLYNGCCYVMGCSLVIQFFSWMPMLDLHRSGLGVSK